MAPKYNSGYINCYRFIVEGYEYKKTQKKLRLIFALYWNTEEQLIFRYSSSMFVHIRFVGLYRSTMVRNHVLASDLTCIVVKLQL